MARVLDFRNRHMGEQIIVAGNGRSLAQMDLAKIKGPSFGVNRIFLHPSWHPTYYCAESKKLCQAVSEKILRYDRPKSKFIANRCRTYLDTNKLGGWQVPYLREVVWCNLPTKTSRLRPDFSNKCHSYIAHGKNVVYMAIQLAFYMGAEQVVLVGLDFDYSDGAVPAKHFYPNKLQGEHPVDKTDKETILAHYKLANKLFNNAPGRLRIVNATPGSQLDVFPRVSFDRIIRR